MSKSKNMQNHVIAMIWDKTKNKPIFSSEIERRLSISGVIIREIVHRARTELNLPICAEHKGYFMPKHKTEAMGTIRSLRSRAKQNIEAADGIETYFEEKNQMRLI